MKPVKIIFAGIYFFACTLTSFAQKKPAERKPNIIIIYADDLGWKELSAFGNTRLSTPHIDSLGITGSRFSMAYSSAPICSPSRAGLITGRYQQRFGFEYLDPIELPYSNPTVTDRKVVNNNPSKAFNFSALVETDVDPESFKEIRKGIPETELTLAEVLKLNGYQTALTGKWHLGEKTGFYPTQNGFDYFYGCLNWGTLYTDESNPDVISRPRYFEKYLSPSLRSGSYNLWRNTDSIHESRYLTDVLADEAINFISTNKSKPFFLYLPFNAVHDPLQAKKVDFDGITTVHDSAIRIQLAMTKALDDAVGRVLSSVKQLGLEDNTIVFFSSDNGGPTYYKAVDNTPLKGGKLSHFEGGIRVPYFIKYPGKIPAGKVYDLPVSNLDIFPTALAAAGVSMPDGREIDGVNLIPYVNGTNTNRPHEILYWRNGYSKAIRKGDWKLYTNERNGVMYLYDLSKDMRETTDLSQQFPGKVKELQQDFKTWETKTIKPTWPNTRNVLLPVGDEFYYFPI